jgi:uncharacterized protein (TIGR02145 family)
LISNKKQWTKPRHNGASLPSLTCSPGLGVANQREKEFSNMKKTTLALLLICAAVFAQQKGTFTDSRDKKTYKTVKIKIHTWLAENLNYDDKSAKCYENKPENCKKYGRLYNHEAAEKACPKGWRLPRDEDWMRLVEYAGTEEPGLKLKAKNSWDQNCYLEKPANCNGKDNLGFAALAGGYREVFGSDDDITERYATLGDHGYWWTEEDAARMASYYNEIRFGYYRSRDRYSFSIRCLKELTAAEKADSTKKVKADSIAKEKAIADSIAKAKADSLAKAKAQADSVAKILKTASLDPRDKKQYKAAKIGEQIWMAENLDYNAEGSKCYDNKPENCKKYGRLYNWITALKLPSACADNNCANQIRKKHQGICPDGWHIPNNSEWNELKRVAGGTSSAGIKLKTKSDWKNGTDELSFSALPGGYGKADGGFDAVGGGGLWWDATNEFSNYQTMSNTRDDVYGGNVAKNLLLSLRCIYGEASNETLPPVTIAPAKAPAPAKAAAPANTPPKTMYCVSYVTGKPVSCLEIKDTQDAKKICDIQSKGMKMMLGEAKLTETKPSIKCDK